MNWYNNGFETAKGTIGIGWMAFGKPEADEVLKENNITFDDLIKPDDVIRIISEWVTGWRETEQWHFEVGKHMPKPIIKNEINYKCMEAQDEWINGYSEYAYTYMVHSARNHLGVCPICGEFIDDCLVNNTSSWDTFYINADGFIGREETGEPSYESGIYCNNCFAILSTDEEELPSLIKGELVKTKDQVMIDTFFYYDNMIKVYKSIIKDFNKLANKNNKK